MCSIQIVKKKIYSGYAVNAPKISALSAYILTLYNENWRVCTTDLFMRPTFKRHYIVLDAFAWTYFLYAPKMCILSRYQQNLSQVCRYMQAQMPANHAKTEWRNSSCAVIDCRLRAAWCIFWGHKAISLDFWQFLSYFYIFLDKN